jgi:ABC-type phosphate transport system substrate-binding protein
VLGASADRPALMLDGIQAAPQTAASQQYPLSLPIYLVALREPHGPLRALLSWLQSADGQRLVGENYGQVG